MKAKRKKKLLFPFLGTIFEDFEGRTGIAVNFSAEKIGREPKRSTWVHLFKILQEALNNIRKHSQANQVNINFQTKENEIRLEIQDNGIGYKELKGINDSDSWLPFGKYGLIGMEQRAKMLGGTFSIQNEYRKGLKITVTLPMRKGLPLSRKLKNGKPFLVAILDFLKRNSSVYFEIENRQIFSSINFEELPRGSKTTDFINKVKKLQPGVIVFDVGLSKKYTEFY